MVFNAAKQNQGAEKWARKTIHSAIQKDQKKKKKKEITEEKVRNREDRVKRSNMYLVGVRRSQILWGRDNI